MPCVTLYTAPSVSSSALPIPISNSLPGLLQTPSGLALLEIQGTIHAPFPLEDSDQSSTTSQTDIGRLEFPLYDPATDGTGEGKWMKKVYLYVGKHQRLVGEVKKLPKAMALVRKRVNGEASGSMEWEGNGEVNGSREGEELEIAELVRWKIIFGGRPEPVGGEMDEGASGG